ncbi:Asp-tRNA(Asn)/Glu-tRNA(Gln) amidotransferase subunit GatA [Candidatus Parcubacteria bacterium]|nr:MAG: Asp-tRNA(Asn)/Glu-tRNA(Gln) amidotransferase subunit GatA [Candidatus Parcubacteria bacterium]
MVEALTVKTFHQGLVEKKFSAAEVFREYLARIKKKDREIRAYLSLFETWGAKKAEGVDNAIAKGETPGPLWGVPVALKDNILTRGHETTAGSKILENYAASYDAGVVARLNQERAVFLGKTNLDEFAMGSSTENSGFKATRNPHDPERIPGGSSGGSAAAVAADLALAALGSDTGGSIRQPAAFCGVVGLKPTYGAVSRSGLIAMASSLDQIGPIAKTVEDAAILFKGIAGLDPLDATSSSREYGEEITNPDFESIKRLRIGVPKEYFIEGMDPVVAKGVENAMEKLKKIGFEFKNISLPHTKYALSCYYIVMPAEVSSNLARFDGVRYARIEGVGGGTLRDVYFGQRGSGFGAEAKRRIILGTFVLSSGYYDAYYDKAQRVRALISRDFENAFKDIDVILAPVTPTPAFRAGEKTGDPFSMYLSDIFTIPANLAGLPGLSIPVERTKYSKENLPIGFQLIGRRFREADILGIGQLYEK